MAELQNPYAQQILPPPTATQQRGGMSQDEPFVSPSFEVFYVPHHGRSQLLSRLDRSAEYLQLIRHYTFVESRRMIEDILAEEPSLHSLLSEAVVPLRAAFGEVRLVRVKAQAQEDDKMLRVTVQLPSTINFDPEEALQRFDADWWLDNCSRSRGVLVFDYEIQDAV